MRTVFNPYVEHHLVATSTTVLYQWFTDWLPADGVDNIRAVLKCKNGGASFSWQLAIQTAAVRADAPDSPALLGAQQTGSGEYQTGDISVSGSTGTKRMFRLGIAYNSQGTVQQGDVGLEAGWKEFGTPLGARTVELSALDTGTKYAVLTPWIPATFMSKIKAAFSLNSITGGTSNLRYQLAYQTAGTSVQQPGAWTNAEPNGFVTPSATYDERNTGELTASTTDMWFRIGVAYGLTSGVDNNITAVLEAACSFR